MKRSEVVKKYYTEIADAMKDAFENIMRCTNRGGYEHQIYVWEDGEIEGLVGDGFLQPKQGEDRDLIYVATVRGEWCDDEDLEDVIADYNPTWQIDTKIMELEAREAEDD